MDAELLRLLNRDMDRVFSEAGLERREEEPAPEPMRIDIRFIRDRENRLIGAVGESGGYKVTLDNIKHDDEGRVLDMTMWRVKK
jgi:hypothetical protein